MITHKIPLQTRVFSYVLVSLLFVSTYVSAAPLEDVSLSEGTDNSIKATIRLSVTVANVRYTPTKKGSTLSILLDKLPDGLIKTEWRDNEVLTSPPSSLIPSFTVKTNLKNIQPKLIVEFSREAEYTVQMGRDSRSIIINIKIDKELPKYDGSLPQLPEVETPAEDASEINKKAAAFMLSGRNSLAVGDNLAAIDVFNKLLLLPPNSYTQDGQEWVGVARERAGQLDKAKLELELYLKLYKNPEDVKRIKFRIASLGSKPIKTAPITSISAKEKKSQSQTLSYGSLSMHYYHGASKTDTVDSATPFSNALSNTTFSTVDQSALLTTVVATTRFINETYDNRLVFQDTAYSNFLPDRPGRNRLGAAYFEIKNKVSDYSIRLGRQSSSGGGVLGRFDGVYAGVGVTPSIRVNAVAGQLSDIPLDAKTTFYGSSIDIGLVSIYTITQKADDIVERQAVGSEVRYFDPTKSAFLLLDYDTLFSELNVAMLQSTYTATPERNYSLFIDHRRTPYLTTRNALYGALTTSLTDLLLFMTEEQIRILAANRTGTSDLVQLGVTQQVSDRWQVGGDIRVSRFGATPESGTPIDIFADPNAPLPADGFVSAQDSTGNDWAFSQQLIGSNLYSTRDTTVFNLSFMGSPLYKGQSFYIYSRGNFTDKWSMDFSLQFYRQNFESGVLLTRYMPMLRTAYQIRQSVSLDFETGFELSHTEVGTQITEGRRQFFSLGFRWDF